MKNTDFMISSFKKALNKPKTVLFKDFILCYRNSESGFIFTDRGLCNFSPYFIDKAQMEELLSKLKSDIKRNKVLKAESEDFDHYYTENIIVEEKTKKDLALRLKFGLHSLSRQAAQVKCLIACLIPFDVLQKIPQFAKQFSQIQLQILQCLRENEDAVKTLMINDFSEYYNKICNRFNFADLFCPHNKKVLNKRLNEIVELLIKKQSLPADFADGNIFSKPPLTGKYGEDYRNRYIDALLYLSEKIVLMRDNRDLLELVRLCVKKDKNFSKELQYFRNSHYSPNLDEVVKIRVSAQKVYEKFAEICYLDAVSKSFEIFYIVDNPNERNLPLPTVAPDKEIKKIEKIAERSKTIPARGKLAKDYYSSATEFEKALIELKSALENYETTKVN